MREAQPVAFRASWKLTAVYESYAEEDGEGAWAAAPKAPADTLMYEEVYVQRMLHAPSDPESVIIKRPHSFGDAVSSQLLPPHPLDVSDRHEADTLPTGKHSHTISLHLYAPITCAESAHWPAPSRSFTPCLASQMALLDTLKKTKKVTGASELDTHVELLQLLKKEEEPLPKVRVSAL